MDVQLPDGRILRGVPDGTTKMQLAEKLKSNGIDVPSEWVGVATPPAPNLGAFNMPFMSRLRGAAADASEFAEKELTPAKAVAGTGEAALALGTGTAAEPIAGLAGIAATPFGKGPEAVEATRSALSYQPRTAIGRGLTQAVAFPFEQAAKGADKAGGVVTDVTGSPALGTLVKTALEGGAAAVGGRKVATVTRKPDVGPTRIPGETPHERAKAYVDTRTNLDWDSLADAVKTRLKEVAATGSNLERLDATAFERQALLASLPRPITNPTRGQVTRDPLQQRNEQLAKATEAGDELRALDIEHNKALIENLDVLRGKTGATAVGDIQTGQSVQGALRERHAAESARVRSLYKDAEKAGETQGPVNIDKLVNYLKNHEDPTMVGYATSKLKALKAISDEANGGISVSQARPLSFAELEGIRKAASTAGKSADGTVRHYAKELRDVIEDVMSEAGGDAGAKYSAARSARKAVGEEFERTAAVARLVKNQRMSKDRATAVEDTWRKSVLTGSLDDLKNVRTSLEKTPRGTQAWNDLKAATIDYIKDRATGGDLGLKNQAGDLNATWGSLRRAVDEIGPEKLREMFGDQGAKQIEAVVEAAQILKTEAPTGIKGSPTMDKLLTLLDRVGKTPGLGKATELVAGTARLVEKAKDIGKTGREVRKAKTTPLDEAAK
jgi:hypothetical protein